MTPRDRALAALSHRQPDQVPYHVTFTQAAHARMAEFYGDADFEAKLGNCLAGAACTPKGAWKEVAPDVWRDEFGVTWDRSVDKDIGVPSNRLVTAENADSFALPNPRDPARYAELKEALPQKKDRLLVANLGFSLFERAWTLAGMEDVLIAMATDAGFVNRLLDRILDFNLAVIEEACAVDIDAMRFGDDWGMQTGLIMGPALWREFIKPRIKKMYSLVKARKKFVFIHSCGKVDEIFDDLIECGVDAFNPFQPEAMDVFSVKKKYGGRLSFFGGISTQKTLPYGTPEETRDEVGRLLGEIGRGGGYIASPAHDVPADARPENVAAMMEVLRNQAPPREINRHCPKPHRK